jgi:predicted Zn-dependent peptidase
MESIAKNVTEIQLPHGERIFIAPMKAKDVVSFEGSFYGGWNMLPDALGQVPMLAAELLDAGTKSRSKDVIRGTLAAKGASLSFSAGGDRTYFSGSCLPEDLSAVLKIAAECISEPALPAKELAAAKERELGNFEEEKSETNAQGAIAFSQMIYDAKHVNYAETTDEKIKGTKKVVRTDVASFAKKFGRGGLVVAITGDVDVASATKAATSAFGRLAEGVTEIPAKKKNTKSAKAFEKHILIKDKANIDTFIGAAVPLTYDSPEYLAFSTMVDMLGGRGLSTGHLMRTVREQHGLTYGIYAMPYGFGDGADGAFRIWATFSPATYKKAIETTLIEMKNFFASGITQEALETKQEETTGRYLVALATTRGLASRLHSIGIQRKQLSYLDEYPLLINRLTLTEIEDAATLVPMGALSIAAAGTFQK